MSAQKKLKTKKISKDQFLRFLILLTTVILPALILILVVVLFFRSGTGKVPKEETFKLEGEMIKPSQLLEDRLKYKDKKITLLGRIDQASVTCEKKECPREDPCCGCPQEGNLEIFDPERVLTKKTPWRLRVLAPGGQAFCQRKAGSCDYECPDWEMGEVYEVTGTFFAELPPAGTGWRMYFSFYFEVDNKKLVGRSNLLQLPGGLFEEIKQSIKNFKTSGYYVLQ